MDHSPPSQKKHFQLYTAGYRTTSSLWIGATHLTTEQ